MGLFDAFSARFVSYECFNCGEDMQSSAALRGKTDTCPHCGWKNAVPAKSGGSVSPTPYQLFRRALDASDVQEKVRLLKQALEICPTHQRSLKELGILLQDQCREYALAAEYLLRAADNAIEVLNSEPILDFRMNLLDRAATCYTHVGRYADAVSLWERVLREGRWSPNAAGKIRYDLEAARAKMQGRPAPARTYGSRRQTAAGIDRVLNTLESRSLAEACAQATGRDELVTLVQSWGFPKEDAENLVYDALLCCASAKGETLRLRRRKFGDAT